MDSPEEEKGYFMACRLPPGPFVSGWTDTKILVGKDSSQILGVTNARGQPYNGNGIDPISGRRQTSKLIAISDPSLSSSSHFAVASPPSIISRMHHNAATLVLDGLHFCNANTTGRDVACERSGKLESSRLSGTILVWQRL